MSLSAQDLVAEAKKQVPAISCQDYILLRQRGEPHILIDVREQNEWDVGHIENAIHLPRGILEFKIHEVAPNKNATIIVLCASGGRGALCGASLVKMGYSQVMNLEGGYKEYCATTQK